MSERPEKPVGLSCPCHTNTGGKCVGVLVNNVCTRCRRRFSEDEVGWLEYARKKDSEREEWDVRDE